MRLNKTRLIIAAPLLIGVLLGLYIYNTHRNKLQVPQSNNAVSSTGGIAISTAPTTGSISIGNETPQTQELLKQINNARATNGISPVTENSLLDKSAKLKADDMIAKNYWSHNAPDGTQWMSFIQQVGYAYSAAAENLSYGQYRYYPEQTIVNNWLNSPEHKENMLNGRYTEIGIAIEKAQSFNGQQDVWVIVTHYGTPTKQTSGASSGTRQLNSSYSSSSSVYVPSSLPSTPMPSFDRTSPAYQPPSQQQCGSNVDSSYYANCSSQ